MEIDGQHMMICKTIRLKLLDIAKNNSRGAGNEESLCKMGASTADRITMPKLPQSLCHKFEHA